MELFSRIYGSVDVCEPVLVDLMESKTVQRLKGINQGGVPFEYYGTRMCSRYDHSVGVMLLLRTVGANIEEQAAGLLHDASHTAFSHVADWVFGHQLNEDFQDSIHEKYLMKSDAAEIIDKHGLDLSKIADCHQYSLLEQDVPMLCADRVDYTLHEMVVGFGYNPGEVARCANSLVTVNGKLCFDNLDQAGYFGRNYVKAQNQNWGRESHKVRYAVFADILKMAINRGILEVDDFWLDDNYCMNLVLNSGDKDLLRGLSLLEKGLTYEVVDGSQLSDCRRLNGSCFEISKKLRWVDPLVVSDNTAVVLSSIDKEYKELLANQREAHGTVQKVWVHGWPNSNGK